MDKAKIDERVARCLREDPNGSRDYIGTLDTSVKRRCFRFYEFDSAFVNRLYIWMFKGICGFLWILLRIWLKSKKLFKRS